MQKKFKSEKAIIIARVSSHDQEEGFSIDSQENVAREYAIKQNLKVVKVFSFVESAKNQEREKFDEACEYAIQNNIHHLLVEKPDRFTRNPFSQAKAYTLIYEYDKAIHFFKQNFVFSKESTSDEKFRFNIEASLSQKYIDNLSEEVKKAQKVKIEQYGQYPGQAPLGYLNKTISGQKVVVPDPVLAPLIRKAFVMASTGKYSTCKIIDLLYVEGLGHRKNGKRLSKGTLYGVLRNPFYCGWFRWAGKQHRGKYEPLISKELFDKVQAVLSKSKPIQLGAIQYAFNGLIRCEECGCVFVGETKTKKNGNVYTYYRCNDAKRVHAKKKYFREEAIADLLGEGVKALEFSNDILEYVTSILIKHHSSEKDFRDENIDYLQRRVKLIQGYMDQAYEDKMQGKITESYWHIRYNTWQKEIDELEGKIKQHRNADQEYKKFGVSILELAKDSYRLYSQANMKLKGELVNFLYSNCTFDGVTMQYQMKKPFDIIAKGLVRSKWLGMTGSARDDRVARDDGGGGGGGGNRTHVWLL